MQKETAVIEVDGLELTRWVSYRIDSDLLTPADAFWVQVDLPTSDPANLSAARDRVRPGREIKLYIDRHSGRGRARALQLTGWIDRRSMKVSRDGGTVLTIEGRDRAGILCDAGVDPMLRVETDRLLGRTTNLLTLPETTFRAGETRTSSRPAKVENVEFRRREGVSFLDLARQAVSPWEIEVLADDSAARSVLTGERVSRPRSDLLRREARAAGVPPVSYSRGAQERAAAAGMPLDEYLGVEASSGARFASGMAPSDVQRLKVNEAAPRVGETVWEFLDRHAKRLGLMMWMTADGRLVIGAPDYGQEPLYRLIRRVRPRPDDPNTIVDGGLEETIAPRYSSVTVYGRGGGRGNETRSSFRATTSDPEWDAPFHKPRYVKDEAARSDDAVVRRATREIALGREHGFALSYTVYGHGQRGVLWAQGTVAYVEDERLGIADNYFVTARTFERSRSAPTSTSVRLVPLGSIVL